MNFLEMNYHPSKFDFLIVGYTKIFLGSQYTVNNIWNNNYLLFYDSKIK